MAGELSSQTADFIRTYIESLEELEILLLLFQGRDRGWTVEAVYDGIRSNPASIRQRLKRLVEKGIVEMRNPGEEQFSYKLGSPELNAAVEGLAAAYKERRVTVVESIFAKSPSPIQGFADAFRIRKDSKDG